MSTKEKTSLVIPRWRKILSPGVCICLIIIVACLIGSVVALTHPRTKKSAEVYTVADFAPLDLVKPDDVLEQHFTVDGDFSSFGLYFANYSKPIHQGDLLITIQPDNGPVTTIKRQLGSLLDNNFTYFDYDMSAGTSYTLRIRTEGTDSPITFFTSISDKNPASLLINGKQSDRHLIMAFAKPQKDIFAAWYFVMGAALAGFIALVIVNKEFYGHQKSAR